MSSTATAYNTIYSQEDYFSSSHSHDSSEDLRDTTFWDTQLLFADNSLLANEDWSSTITTNCPPHQNPMYSSPTESDLSDHSMPVEQESTAPCGTCASCSRPKDPTRKTSRKKSTCPQAQARRRQQNREAQRSYRERQDRQKKVLEQQVEAAVKAHRDLVQSLSLQSAEVVQLKWTIESLQFELKAVSAWRSSAVKVESIDGGKDSLGLQPVNIVDEDVLVSEDGHGDGQW